MPGKRAPKRCLVAVLSLYKLLQVLIVIVASAADGAPGSNNGNNERKSSPNDNTNIFGHVVPHSHCDAAYKMTVDEYYETKVRLILSSVLDALLDCAERRFSWSETIFLSRFFQDPRTMSRQKKGLRKLLREGRFTLINGGWVMHDESITRYDSQIQQMTHGHDCLQELLRGKENEEGIPVTIRTAWQIDPFGPAAHSVNLFDWADMPFLVTNRIPQVMKEELMANQSLEFTWKVSSKNTSVLVHVLDHHYDCPAGFDWEKEGSPEITNANVKARSDAYMRVVLNRSRYFLTPNVFIPFGDDFRFVNATLQFQNMDRIVSYVQEHPDQYKGMTLRYSTPDEYYSAVLASLKNQTKTIKEANDAPLATTIALPTITGSPFLNYWTGYYTQLPVLKQMVRSAELLLRTVKMTQFSQWSQSLSNPTDSRDNCILPSASKERLRQAEETVWLMQHHDAITSTSYRFVLMDYMKRLQQAYRIMTDILTEVVVDHRKGMVMDMHPKQLLVHFDELQQVPSRLSLSSNNTAYAYASVGGTDEKGAIVGGGPYFHETALVRGSSARTLEIDKIVDPKRGQPDVRLVVLNSLSWEIDTLVSFVCTRPDVAVVVYSEAQSEIIVSTQATPLERELESPSLGLFLISFRAQISSLGSAEYGVRVCESGCANLANPMSDHDISDDGLSSSSIHVAFDKDTNDISQLTLLAEHGQSTMHIFHDIVLYDGVNDTIYDMRTSKSDSDPVPLLGKKKRRIVSAFKGVLFSQITLELNSWLKVRYRLINKPSKASTPSLGNLLEVSMLAGPTPMLYNIVSRFFTNFGPGSRWFYDENGFLPVEGSFNASLGVGYNIRPLVSRTWLLEAVGNRSRSSCSKSLTAFSVDPRGVVSRGDGSLDVFWKRRNNQTRIEQNGDNDWMKQGNDESQSRSSIWIQFDCTRNNDWHDKSSDIPVSLPPIASRSLALQLAHDVVALRLPPRKVANMAHLNVSSPLFQKIPPTLHIISIRIDEFWIDMQLENLASSPAAVEIRALVSKGVATMVGKVSLRSLTFLYEHPDENESCRVKNDRVVLSQGRICSLRTTLVKQGHLGESLD